MPFEAELGLMSAVVHDKTFIAGVIGGGVVAGAIIYVMLIRVAALIGAAAMFAVAYAQGGGKRVAEVAELIQRQIMGEPMFWMGIGSGTLLVILSAIMMRSWK